MPSAVVMFGPTYVPHHPCQPSLFNALLVSVHGRGCLKEACVCVHVRARVRVRVFASCEDLKALFMPTLVRTTLHSGLELGHRGGVGAPIALNQQAVVAGVKKSRRIQASHGDCFHAPLGQPLPRTACVGLVARRVCCIDVLPSLALTWQKTSTPS